MLWVAKDHCCVFNSLGYHLILNICYQYSLIISIFHFSVNLGLSSANDATILYKIKKGDILLRLSELQSC